MPWEGIQTGVSTCRGEKAGEWGTLPATVQGDAQSPVGCVGRVGGGLTWGKGWPPRPPHRRGSPSWITAANNSQAQAVPIRGARTLPVSFRDFSGRLVRNDSQFNGPRCKYFRLV